MHFFLGNRKLVKADEESAATGLEGLAKAVDSGMSASDVATVIGGNYKCAAGMLLSKLINNTGDCCVFVCSDSTGSGTNRWVYKYAEWIAHNFPLFTVKYQQWDSESDSYDDETIISIGSGENTVRIYNGAVSGSKVSYLMGYRFDIAVSDIPDADLLIINHGHNHLSSYEASDNGVNMGFIPQFLSSIENIRSRHPQAGIIMLTQNPRRDDDTYKHQQRAITMTAGLLGADIADSYTAFEKENRDHKWYADNIHPSDDYGTPAYLRSIIGAHLSTSPLVSIFHNSKNYLPNGDFSSFDSTVPDEWSAGSGVLVSKNTGTYESTNGYSVELEIGGTGATFTNSITASELNILKGGWVTFAVRQYIPTEQNKSVGRPSIQTSSTLMNHVTTTDDHGGWAWRAVSAYVGKDDTFITARLYVDSSTTAGQKTIVDRAVLCKGRVFNIE